MLNRLFATLAAVAFAFALPAHAKVTPGQEIDDSAITAEIKAALIDHKDTHATKINVETYKGIVQLSGFANSRLEAQRAEVLARETAGVKSVKNDIRLAQNQ